MAGAHLQLARLVVLPIQVLDHHRVESDPALLAVQLEDLAVLVHRRILREDLVGDAAQERFVGE